MGEEVVEGSRDGGAELWVCVCGCVCVSEGLIVWDERGVVRFIYRYIHTHSHKHKHTHIPAAGRRG
jgi:hypothetical protein